MIFVSDKRNKIVEANSVFYKASKDDKGNVIDYKILACPTGTNGTQVLGVVDTEDLAKDVIANVALRLAGTPVFEYVELPDGKHVDADKNPTITRQLQIKNVVIPGLIDIGGIISALATKK